MLKERRAPARAVDEPMTSRQWLAVLVCVALNIIDGFDILVMPTAAGSLRKTLGLSAGELGFVLSASLAGMTVGALLIAPLGDWVGRRPLILLCLAVEAAGMLAAGAAAGHLDLMAYRFVAGVGVGGMMPVLNTAVAEVSSLKRRNLAITLQATGYPVGGLLAALVGGAMLASYGWRPLLQSACILAVVGLMLTALFLPESVAYLLARRSSASLARINHSLKILGRPRLDSLPALGQIVRENDAGRFPMRGALAKRLVLFSGSTFLAQFSFYFFLSWLPATLHANLAGLIPVTNGAVALNLGGVVGDLAFGALCFWLRARVLGWISLLFAFAAVSLIGLTLTAPHLLVFLELLSGAALFAAMAGIYATAPTIFPARVRAGGTGVAFSLGRFGGALSPMIGAWALNRPDLGLEGALLLMGLPLLGAAALLALVGSEDALE